MTFGASERSGRLIGGLHHVGHLVRDIEEAAALYRRLGFVVPASAFPVLPGAPGQRAPVLSAGNAHIQFEANFVELATVASDIANRPPAGAEIVMLRVPDVAVPRIRQELESAATRLANALKRFEGVHILVLEAADVEAATQMLSASGVVCGSVSRIRRPVRRAGATEELSIGFVEIENDQRSPEGRLAIAEPLPDVEAPSHSNGAIELVEVLLCVPSDQLPQHIERYQRYLQQSGRADDHSHLFQLARHQVRIVGDRDVAALLPGEKARRLGQGGYVEAAPAFLGYSVAVQHLTATRQLLEPHFPIQQSAWGAAFVPSSAALGATIGFVSRRQS
jgi:catechol 2,3-dioxygenase-like lactoylglutathione lyase family enzyme